MWIFCREFLADGYLRVMLFINYFMYLMHTLNCHSLCVSLNVKWLGSMGCVNLLTFSFIFQWMRYLSWSCEQRGSDHHADVVWDMRSLPPILLLANTRIPVSRWRFVDTMFQLSYSEWLEKYIVSYNSIHVVRHILIWKWDTKYIIN